MQSVLAAAVMFCPESHSALLALHCTTLPIIVNLCITKSSCKPCFQLYSSQSSGPRGRPYPRSLMSYPRVCTREEEKKGRKKRWRVSSPLFSLPKQNKAHFIVFYVLFLAFYATFPVLLIGRDLGKNKNHTNSWLLAQGERAPEILSCSRQSPLKSLDCWHYHGGNTEFPVTLSVVKTARVNSPKSTENSTYAESKKGSYKKNLNMS